MTKSQNRQTHETSLEQMTPHKRLLGRKENPTFSKQPKRKDFRTSILKLKESAGEKQLF